MSESRGRINSAKPLQCDGPMVNDAVISFVVAEGPIINPCRLPSEAGARR
jgi:hypothetical protein